MRVQMQRSRSGDRQPPQGGGPNLGKEIMKAEHYPLSNHGEGDGNHERGVTYKYNKREQSVRNPEHAVASPRSRDFTEVLSKPRI